MNHVMPAAAIGVTAWSAAEYGMHRFLMHEQRGRNLASREHLQHHADPNWSSPKWVESWIGVGAIGATSVALPLTLVWGRVAGAAAMGGWVVGYAAYERLHYNAHRFAPRNRYSRWLRRHHFHHHFGHPMRNHGVTTPLWDKVFGTLDHVDRVRVPRRLAMAWLLNEEGQVKPGHAADYEVVEGRRPTSAENDQRRAFANMAPVP